jgi:hypothetical protein
VDAARVDAMLIVSAFEHDAEIPPRMIVQRPIFVAPANNVIVDIEEGVLLDLPPSQHVGLDRRIAGMRTSGRRRLVSLTWL